MSQRLRFSDLHDIFGADSGKEDEDKDKDTDTDPDNPDEDEDLDEDEEDEEETVESLKEKLAAAEADRARDHRRMRRADRAKSKADTELKALKEGGQKELAEALEKAQALQEKLEAASGTDDTAVIREEFRDYDEVKWHNPKLAFSLLDLSEIDVEDGKIDTASFTDAVKKLALEHAYLIKKAAKLEDEDEEQDETPKPRSGSHSVRNRQTSKNKRTQELAKKFNIAGRI